MPPVTGAVKHEGGYRGGYEDNDDRHRHAQDVAEIDRTIKRLDFRVAQRDRPALRQPCGQAAINAHGAERGDEGFDTANGGDEAVRQPAGSPDGERQRHGGKQH